MVNKSKSKTSNASVKAEKIITNTNEAITSLLNADGYGPSAAGYFSRIEASAKGVASGKEASISSSKIRTIFDSADPIFIEKLEVYRSAFLNSIVHIHNGELEPEAAISTLTSQIKGLLELSHVFMRRKGKAPICETVDNISEYVFGNLLLLLIFMGKAKAANATEDFKPLSSFLYSFAIHFDYLVESLEDVKTPKDFAASKSVPKHCKTVLRLWDSLLLLVSAKDRKLRSAFCTLTHPIVKNACVDEIMVSDAFFEKHVSTFLALLVDVNKDVRYYCLQLLQHFQDDRVRKEILKRLNDPSAFIRLTAVTCLEIPEEPDDCIPVLRHLIARIGDVSKDVRIGVYRKLSSLYSSIPVEMCIQIFSCGMAEKKHAVKMVFLSMFTSWMDFCGGLLPFIGDMMSQASDLSLLEDVLGFYMESSGFLGIFFEDPKEVRGSKDKGQTTFGSLMRRFKMLNPSELLLLAVFFQNNASVEQKKEINIIDTISYMHFLFESFWKDSVTTKVDVMAIEEDDNDGFVDALETDLTLAVYKYTESERKTLLSMYENEDIALHALRYLLIISHFGELEDSYQVALSEGVCEKILLCGPVKRMVMGLMSEIVSQTSLGNNSLIHTMPSRWLKSGFVFVTISFLRCVYARKLKFEGKLTGNDDKVEKKHFELSVTRKILSIISDIRDPFQASDMPDLIIKREELEKMELSKIQQFSVSSYSIEHLNKFDHKLCEQMDRIHAKRAELMNIKNSKRRRKHANSDAEFSVAHRKVNELDDLMEKLVAFTKIIRNRLKDRWIRILTIVEAFLGQTRSDCDCDAGLVEFPREILLPQMTFFCSTVIQWQDQDLVDQYCDILTSKCLGTWCMLSNERTELLRQLNAFHIALKGALVILENSIDQLSDTFSSSLKYRIELQTLRCEMYITTLTDLMVTNLDLRRQVSHENEERSTTLVREIAQTIWGLVNGLRKTTKYVQSIAIRMGCKLILTEFLKGTALESMKDNAKVDTTEVDDATVRHLRGLLELTFIAPTSNRVVLNDFKFLKSTKEFVISAEDKMAILCTCALYPTLSYRHLKIFHRALEQVLTCSVHHALQLNLQITDFTHLISFMVQTILHKGPLYFSAENFSKYLKWILLITIDRGSVLAGKAGFIPLIASLISIFIRRKFDNLSIASDSSDLPEDGSLCDLCAAKDPSLTLLDLRDIKVLLNYILTQSGFVRVKYNSKILSDLINLVAEKMQKLAKLHLGSLEGGANGVSVNRSDPTKIKFLVDDSNAFSDLVDVYDAYIQTLESRELYAVLQPEQSDRKIQNTRQRAKRESNRAKDSQRYSEDEEEEEEEFYDNDYG